jgi:4-diphosphocytidyl-2-C-methyl-D-erythritol kinase
MPTDPTIRPFNGPMTWRAFAKVNEELRVLGRRPDGYHEVLTVLRTIDLADEMRVAPAPDFRFSTTAGPVGETNLVVRAVRAFERATGTEVRLDIRLAKSIPAGAGLGGGSADAAVTLLGLRRWFAPDLPAAALREMLASIGADVPFFALGGSVLATGRGDVLFPLGVGESRRPGAGDWYLLVHPGVPVATADAYAWLDESRSRARDKGDECPRRPDPPAGQEPDPRAGQELDQVATVSDPAAGNAHSRLTETNEYTTIFGFCARFAPLLWAPEPGPASRLNDFELPLFQRYPELAEIKGRLLAGGAVVAAVSGSGSTLFGRFRDPAVAAESAESLGREYDVSLVRSLGRREYFSLLFGQ